MKAKLLDMMTHDASSIEDPVDLEELDNHEGENEKKKKQKLGESSSGKEPIILESTHHETRPSPTEQPQEHEMLHEDFSSGLAKRTLKMGINMGSSVSGVEVVEWRENGENVLAGKSGRSEQYQLFKRGRDEYYVGFGGFTQLVPGVIKD
nr:hypothetical protein [Tanacetum cinerariifolium]